MADYFTHLSCLLDVGTPDNAQRALDLYGTFMNEAARNDQPGDSFRLSIHPDGGGAHVLDLSSLKTAGRIDTTQWLIRVLARGGGQRRVP